MKRLLDIRTDAQVSKRTVEYERCYDACKPRCVKHAVSFRKTEALFLNHLQAENVQVDDCVVLL